MRNILIAFVLFAYSAEAIPNQYGPLMFILPKNKKSAQTVYQQDFILLWTFENRNSKAYRKFDMKNMEFTLYVTTLFEEPLKTFVLKDSIMRFTQDIFPPDGNLLITLEAKVRNIKTGEIISYKTDILLIKKEKKPSPVLDSLLAAEPSTQRSQKIVEVFLAHDFFLNAIAQYYNHPEYRTEAYDKFFKEYFNEIIHDKTPGAVLRN